jgi:hypothetical protein
MRASIESDQRISRLAMAAVVAIGAAVGNDLFARRARIDVDSAWQTLSPELRAAGREDALAGPSHLSLEFSGLDDGDSVELILAARPGLGPLTAVAFRGHDPAAHAVLGETSVTIRVPPARGSQITIDVTAPSDAPRRPVYLFHLLGIVVERTGLWPSVRPWLPALVALGLCAWLWRLPGRLAGALWVLLGVTLTTALVPDRIASLASDGRWVWLCGLITLLVALKIAAEPRFRAITKASLAIGVLLLVAVAAHVPRVNGPPAWEWPWQRLDFVTTFGAALVAAIPLFAARALRRPGGPRLAFLLALVSSGVALSASAAMAILPGGLDRMHSIIEDPVVTSYYTDAAVLAHEPDWLATYPRRLPSLHLHTKTKPAGPVLFYVALIRALGEGSMAAAIGGLLIAAGAALAVPATYLLARELGESLDVAFEAACAVALAPSLLLFFPEFDQAFPMITCGLLILWSRAAGGSRGAALCAGLLASFATFFSYSLMTLGVSGLVISARRVRQSVEALAWGLGTALCAYALLHLASGYDPMATFRVALANQARSTAQLDRHYLDGLLSDPWDFMMGAGWLTALLACATLFRLWRSKERNLPAALAVAQIGIVYLSGLVSIETARVWLFLTPLVAIPAGRELATWSAEERSALYVMMVMLLAAVNQNMTFLF